MSGADLGRHLRRSGLRPKMVSAALGVGSAVHAAASRQALTLDWNALAATKAGALISLFVGQRSIERTDDLALSGDEITAFTSAGLLELSSDSLRSRCALLPIGEALICSPWTALPDDSSFHLAGVLPSGPSDWLDIGTGSAFAPLVCAGRAVHASDLDAESLEFAKLGLELSDRSGEIELSRSDLFDSAPSRTFRMVTFNAPIASAAALLGRFWRDVGNFLASGGVAITHSIAGLGPPADAPGLSVTTCYTPENASPGFAVSAWYPDRPTGSIKRNATLSSEKPHARPDWISPEHIG